MPKGLDRPTQEWAKTVFQQLVQEHPPPQGQAWVGKKVGLDQSGVSRAARLGAVSMQALIAAAKLAHRPPEEIEKYIGIKELVAVSTSVAAADAWKHDPPAYTFLSDAQRLPGFTAWLRKNPTIRASQAAIVIDAFFTSPPKCDKDGLPHDGWDHFAADAITGEIVRKPTNGRSPADLERQDLEDLGALPSRPTKKPQPKKPRK